MAVRGTWRYGELGGKGNYGKGTNRPAAASEQRERLVGAKFNPLSESFHCSSKQARRAFGEGQNSTPLASHFNVPVSEQRER